jgi:hypothetical protein
MSPIRGKYLNNSHWIPSAEPTRSAHNNNIIYRLYAGIMTSSVLLLRLYDTRSDVIFNAFYFRSLFVANTLYYNTRLITYVRIYAYIGINIKLYRTSFYYYTYIIYLRYFKF